MGSSRTRRVRQLTLSRKRAWFYITANETQNSGTIGSGTSDDTSSQTLPGWQELVDRLERGLAKTRK